MKRRAFKSPRMMFLLAFSGAIINVAVAWGFATKGDYRYATRSHGGRWLGDIKFDAYSEAQPGILRFNSAFSLLKDIDYREDPNSIVPKWSGFATPSPQFQNGQWTYDSRFGDARGWPMLALWRVEQHSIIESFDNSSRSLGAYDGFNTQIQLGGTLTPLVLPLRPIWPGFAINTIFYTAILWMLFKLPGAMRRRIATRRIKCGQCAACGYSVGESPICTECGAAVFRVTG